MEASPRQPFTSGDHVSPGDGMDVLKLPEISYFSLPETIQCEISNETVRKRPPAESWTPFSQKPISMIHTRWNTVLNL